MRSLLMIAKQFVVVIVVLVVAAEPAAAADEEVVVVVTVVEPTSDTLGWRFLLPSDRRGFGSYSKEEGRVECCVCVG